MNGCSRSHSVKNEANQHALMVTYIAAADHQLVSQRLGTAPWAQKGYAVESIRWPVLQRIRKRSSDPKFNNMGWYLGVKTSACGICWIPPANMRGGEHYRGKALSLGAGESSCCFTAVSAGGVQGLGPSSPCYSPLDQDIADGGRLAFLKGWSQLGSWISLQKQARVVSASCRGYRREKYIRQLYTPDVPVILSVIPLPCCSVKASRE